MVCTTSTPLLFICLAPLLLPVSAFAQRAKAELSIEPVPFTTVRFTGDFWVARLETNRKITIPHVFKRCEEEGRMDNFAIAGGIHEQR